MAKIQELNKQSGKAKVIPKSKGLRRASASKADDRTSKPTEPRLAFRPHMLKWARDRMGWDTEKAARELEISGAQLQRFETGEDLPTEEEGYAFARAYQRSIFEFFLDAVPKTAEEPAPKSEKRTWVRLVAPITYDNLHLVTKNLSIRRERILEVLELLAGEPITFPQTLRFSHDEDPETAAVKVRRQSGLRLSDQRSAARQPGGIINVLWEAVERLGVLVLREPKLRFTPAKGLCVARDPLPLAVIGIAAPEFTLAHELGHIVLGETAVAGQSGSTRSKSKSETWCNRFAAAFLLPEKALTEQFRNSKIGSKMSIAELDTLVRTFGASPMATVYRLFDLNLITGEERDDWKKYWKNKKPFIDVDPGPKLGKLYASIVMQAIERGILSREDASIWMGATDWGQCREFFKGYFGEEAVLY